MESRATLPALLDELAGRFGPREALVSSRRRMTYAELAAESVTIGRALAARGVGKGTRVGLLMPNWPEWIATAFAVWRCGALLVPVNTLCRPRELAHFLRHAYFAALEEIAPGLTRAVPFSRQGVVPALRDLIWVEPRAAGQSVDGTPLHAGAERLPAAWPDLLTDRVVP